MLVKVVPLIAVPVAVVFALTVPPVTVKPVVTSETVNVYQRPLAAVGRVHEGLPDVERLLNVWPDCAAVSATVAPTRALSVIERGNAGPEIPPVAVIAPVTASVEASVEAPVTASVPPREVFSRVLSPAD